MYLSVKLISSSVAYSIKNVIEIFVAYLIYPGGITFCMPFIQFINVGTHFEFVWILIVFFYYLFHTGYDPLKFSIQDRKLNINSGEALTFV